MFRSDNWCGGTPGNAVVLFGAIAVLALVFGAHGAAFADDAPAYRSPPTESGPSSGPSAPGAKRAPGSGQGESQGRGEQDNSGQHEFTPGCRYRERPLNLLV